jgi:twinkle protein
MNATQVKARLLESVEDFCRDWLSGGYKQGREWRCADISGAKPSNGAGSFVVHLSGNHQGIYYENGGSQSSGSLIDIIMAQKGINFKEAIEEARKYLKLPAENCSSVGGFEQKAFGQKKINPASTACKKDWKIIEPGSEVYRYLNEIRNIAHKVLMDWRIGEKVHFFPQANKSLPCFVIPAYSEDGEKLLMAKYIAIERTSEGGKYCMANKGAEYHLLGMHTCDKKSGTIVVCEGEIDAMTVSSAGYNAVSVPFGAKADSEDGEINKGNAWIDNDWDWLQSKSDILLAMDNDKTGIAAQQTLLRRIGLERCLLVTWPEETKDANETFTENYPEFLKALATAKAVNPEMLATINDFREGVWEEFYPKSEDRIGSKMSWDTTGEFPLRIRRGEMSTWQGYTKHGKTTLMSNELVNMIGTELQRICIASMEIKPEKTLRTIIRQFIGKTKPMTATGDPDRKYFDLVCDFLNDHVWFYSKVGECTLESILEVFSYAARRYGVTQFVVDSLMKLDLNEEDLPSVKLVMNKLTAFAREYDVHVHLVAHSKKPTDKRPEDKHWPDKYQICGTGNIVNITHNIFCVYRNVAKENSLAALGAELSVANANGDTSKVADIMKRREVWLSQHDAMFIVQGQREGDGMQPMKRLWFDAGRSWQFFGDKDQQPRDYSQLVWKTWKAVNQR